MFNFLFFPVSIISAIISICPFFSLPKKRTKKTLGPPKYICSDKQIRPDELVRTGISLPPRKSNLSRAILPGLRADQLKIFVNSFSLGACRLIKFCHFLRSWSFIRNSPVRAEYR
jgi:hypothetical protein